MRRDLQRSRRKLMAEINVVPYIDVMLVLLIIFMVTAPLLQQGVTVELPQAQTQSLTAEKEPMIVSVDKNGQYFLNIEDAPLQARDAAQLKLRVAAELARDPKRAILVKGDRSVSYGQVVAVMALLQSAGAKQVGLITQQVGAP